MSELNPMQTLFDNMAEQLADRVSDIVLHRVRSEIAGPLQQVMKIVYSDAEAGDLLGCSAQTMAAKRKKGEIDSTVSPSGRPVYLLHHLLDYLMRHEVRNGSQTVKLADVMNVREPKPRLRAVGGHR